MEIATSQLPRIVRLALIGVGTAFAWIVVSLLLGLGPGQAHADDTDDAGVLGGALGGVTSLVDSTATTVTSTVSTVTTGVAGAVNTVVATAPAPVEQPASQVVQTIGTVVTAATQPVSDVVSGDVVRGIAQPVVDLATDVPIVGGIVTGIGLDDAVADLGGTVDETLTGVVGAVAQTGATFSKTVSSLGQWAAASVSRAVAAVTVVVSSAAPAVSGPLGTAGGLRLPSASAGPGGAGPAAWALAALLPLAAHRAWVRRAGSEDEHAPPAPAGSTDVSPD